MCIYMQRVVVVVNICVYMYSTHSLSHSSGRLWTHSLSRFTALPTFHGLQSLHNERARVPTSVCFLDKYGHGVSLHGRIGSSYAIIR